MIELLKEFDKIVESKSKILKRKLVDTVPNRKGNKRILPTKRSSFNLFLRSM